MVCGDVVNELLPSIVLKIVGSFLHLIPSMAGELPNELGDLVSIQTLDISGNNIGGTFTMCSSADVLHGVVKYVLYITSAIMGSTTDNSIVNQLSYISWSQQQSPHISVNIYHADLVSDSVNSTQEVSLKSSATFGVLNTYILTTTT